MDALASGNARSRPGSAGAGEDGSPGARDGSAAELGGRLLEHYDRHHRDLPWRGETDPYRILVSEVMLQQTRVETVLRYYGRWLERFPDIEALAGAREDEVLLHWEGLGYYSRARRLQGAARVVRDRHGGAIPPDVALLRELPGVGDYTAAAVASIAFGERAAAVDGNVRRVFSRIYDLPDPSPAALWRLADALLDPARPGDSNQALMELGATVCTPRSPRCPTCPLASLCEARRRGSVPRRPEPKARRPLPERRFGLAVLVRPDRRVLLVRREGEGLLAGLWAFPETRLQPEDDPGVGALQLARGLGFQVREGLQLPGVSHAFTHLRARYLPVLFRLQKSERAPRGARWVPSSGHQGVALPTAQRRTLAEVSRVLGEPSPGAAARQSHPVTDPHAP